MLPIDGTDRRPSSMSILDARATAPAMAGTLRYILRPDPLRHSILPSARPTMPLPAHLLSALCATIAAILIPATSHAQQRLPVVPLTAGMYAIQAEVAASDAARERGLMFRQSMPANAGMLFIFEQKAGHCFWMKNTDLPLSIAFLADDGTIVNIEDMRPQTEDNHCPKAAIRYALEMNKGWFAQKGIKAGAKIGGLPQAR
jgi:uncharacterized membrane protein (UPF0127 family)